MSYILGSKYYEKFNVWLQETHPDVTLADWQQELAQKIFLEGYHACKFGELESLIVEFFDQELF